SLCGFSRYRYGESTEAGHARDGDRGSMIANASVRNALMRLPADVKQRLVEQIDEDRFAQTAAHPDATALLTVVYPLERAVEVVDRYVCDLAASAIRCGGLMVERPDEN